MREGDGHQDGVSGRGPSNFKPPATMKIRLFSLALLSGLGLVLSTSDASAFEFLSCFHHNCECRPYNAFTPAPPCCSSQCCLHRHHHHGKQACCQGPICANLPMCGDMG